MRLDIIRGEPIEEVAAEPATLDRFRAVLAAALAGPARPADPGSALNHGRGLLALPFVPDPTIPPMTVRLRPYSTMGPT